MQRESTSQKEQKLRLCGALLREDPEAHTNGKVIKRVNTGSNSELKMTSDSESTRRKKINAEDALICGSIAGAAARIFLNPLDVIKIRLQIQQESTINGHGLKSKDYHQGRHTTATFNSKCNNIETNRMYSIQRAKYFGLFGGMQVIIKEEGLRGLWRGIVPGLWLVVPYTAIQFFVYEQANYVCDMLRLDNHITKTSTSILTGSFAGFVATIVTYPLDVIRTTLAAQGSPCMTMLSAYNFQYKQNAQSLFRGLYRGVTPTLLAVLPYSAIQFASYDVLTRTAKEWMNDSRINSKSNELYVSSLCGLFAGALSKGATHPLDVVKKRFQVSGLPRPSNYGLGIREQQYRDMLHCIRNIAQNEGIRGLYKGYFISVFKAAPAAAITFTVYKETMSILITLREHFSSDSEK